MTHLLLTDVPNSSGLAMVDGHADAGYARRVLSLAAGVIGMIGVGSLYAISAWNAQLKSTLQYSQAGISVVSSMALLGSYLSFFPGIIFDRLGPFKTVLLSAIGLAAVHAFLYVALTLFPTHVNPFAIGFCLLVVGLLSAFNIFASIVSNEGIFGDANRGKVMAVLTSAYSCGGAVFAFVFKRGFDSNVAGYFAFLGAFLFVVSMFGWFVFYRSTQTRRPSEEIIDGVVSVAASPSEKSMLLSTSSVVDMTGWELLQQTRFWLLFASVFITIGAALFVMSNVSFIVESLGGPMDQVPTMVALFSIGNTICRLAAGTLSDLMLPKYPRAAFAALAAVMTAATQLVFLWIPPAYLFVPITLAGMSEGVMFGIYPAIMREAFGLRHYGKNYGLISFANCIGYPLFFSPISSFFYQQHHIASGSPSDDAPRKCFGLDCFRPVFLLILALCGVALVCCLKLVDRQLKSHVRYRVQP
jgi:hypothetical protein